MTHNPDHGGDPGQCDSACVKIIIDGAMVRFALKLYARVIAMTHGLRPVDYHAATFFDEQVEHVFQKVAQILNARHLKPVYQARLMEQVQKECYRADDLVKWSQAESITPELAARWTAKILEWAKDDQTFYTAFNEETAHGGGADSEP